jgi:hypothetical protein
MIMVMVVILIMAMTMMTMSLFEKINVWCMLHVKYEFMGQE